VEYNWEPPRCSTCLIFGHSVDDCPKALKRVVNMVDKGKGGSSGADDEGFVEVKQKKSGGNNGNKNVSISSNSSNMASMTNASTSGNGTFSLSNSVEVLNFDDPTNVEVESGNKASTSSVQEKGQSATPLVEKINMFENQILEGTCVLVDDGKPLKKVDYLDDHNSENEVEPIDNEMAHVLATKPSGV
ncbi:hypothetical protein Tco_0261908, partial [Tanacetum coccineum]